MLLQALCDELVSFLRLAGLACGKTISHLVGLAKGRKAWIMTLWRAERLLSN